MLERHWDGMLELEALEIRQDSQEFAWIDWCSQPGIKARIHKGSPGFASVREDWPGYVLVSVRKASSDRVFCGNTNRTSLLKAPRT